MAANRTLRTLSRLTELANPSVSEVLEAVGGVAGWQVACWWTPVDGRLRCTAVWTEREDLYDEFIKASRAATFLPGIGLPGRVWESGLVWWLPDVVADSNFPRSGTAATSGLRSACGFPVGTGESASVIELFGHDIRPRDDDLVAAYTVAGPLLASLNLT